MKLDDENEVAALFQKSVHVSNKPDIQFDMNAKRFLFRIMSEVITEQGQSSVPISQVW